LKVKNIAGVGMETLKHGGGLTKGWFGPSQVDKTREQKKQQDY